MASDARFVRCAALLVVALVVVARVASAAPPTAAEKETARRLMDEGRARERAGDAAAAAVAYRTAHAIMRVPTTGLAVARAELALGRLVEARDAALDVLRAPKEADEPAPFQAAREAAKAMDATLKPRIPMLTITALNAATVRIDDRPMAPLLRGTQLALNPGRHHLVAANADGVERVVDVDLAEREQRDVDVSVAPAKAASKENRPVMTPESAGKPGRASSGQPTLVFGGIGLAATGAAVGIVSGVMTFSAASSAKASCQGNLCLPAARDDLQSARTLSTVANIAFVAAGVGAVVSVVGLLVPSSNSDASPAKTATLSPWLSPGRTATAGLRGDF